MTIAVDPVCLLDSTVAAHCVCVPTFHIWPPRVLGYSENSGSHRAKQKQMLRPGMVISKVNTPAGALLSGKPAF